MTVTVKVAHVRLCHSRMLFVRAYPRETQEMVFDAHDRAFAFFKGACTRGIYDNMKTAVEAIFVGKERALQPPLPADVQPLSGRADSVHAGLGLGEGAGREPGRAGARALRGCRILRRSAPPPCPRLRKQTGARADREADETAKVTPAAIPPSRTGAQERGAAKKAKRVVQTSKAQEGNNRSADQPSSSGREATTRSKSAPKRNDKPTTAQRTRVAAAQSETSTPPTPPPAAAKSVTEQRVHPFADWGKGQGMSA